MVYYVVAVHQEGQSEKAVEKRLSQIAQSHSSEVHGVNVRNHIIITLCGI